MVLSLQKTIKHFSVEYQDYPYKTLRENCLDKSNMDDRA